MECDYKMFIPQIGTKNKKGMSGVLNILVELILIMAVLLPITIDQSFDSTKINSTLGSNTVTIAHLLPLAVILVALLLMFSPLMKGGQ